MMKRPKKSKKNYTSLVVNNTIPWRRPFSTKFEIYTNETPHFSLRFCSPLLITSTNIHLFTMLVLAY